MTSKQNVNFKLASCPSPLPFDHTLKLEAHGTSTYEYSDNPDLQSHANRNDGSDASLVHNAADMGRNYQDLEYADPYDATQALPTASAKEKRLPLATFLTGGRYPIEQRIENKKRGIGRQKYPFIGKQSSQLSLVTVGWT